jgi:hypothetical protein
MLSFKSNKYPNAYPNSRDPFCICIREHSNPYLYSSKNVIKGVIRIRFHANLISFHPYIQSIDLCLQHDLHCRLETTVQWWSTN